MRRPDRTARRRLAQRGGGGDQERERPRQRRAGETEHARQPRRRRRLSPRARTADRSPSGGAPARDPLRRRGDRRRRQTGRDGHAPRARGDGGDAGERTPRPRRIVTGRRPARRPRPPPRPRHLGPARDRENRESPGDVREGDAKALHRPGVPGHRRRDPERSAGDDRRGDRARSARSPAFRDPCRREACDHALRGARAAAPCRRTELPAGNRPDAPNSRPPGGDRSPAAQRSGLRASRSARRAPRPSLTRLAPGVPPSRHDGAARIRGSSARRLSPSARAAAPVIGKTLGEYELLATDGAARRGRLRLANGTVETPAFMPVGTVATVKGLTPADLRDVDAEIVLANTYHLWLRPGRETIVAAGGLHRFMAWDRPILTDSGGFQVFSLESRRTVDDDGVTFRSHLDGSEHRFTPENVVAFQEDLGVDIAMTLDVCVKLPAERKELETAAQRRRMAPRHDAALRHRPGRRRRNAPGAERARAGRTRSPRLCDRRPLGRRIARGDGPFGLLHGGAPPPAKAPLSDGRRDDLRPDPRHRRGDRYVRLRLSDALRADRARNHPRRRTQYDERALRARFRPARSDLPLHGVPNVFARLHRASLPLRGDARPAPALSTQSGPP